MPVMNEMIPTFEKVIEEQKALGNNNRVKWGERIFNFLDKIEDEFLRIPYSKVERDGQIIDSNYYENFEALCSFIDLNVSFEIKARCENKGIKAALFNKPMFFNYTTSGLKELRGYIANYIYLSLINDQVNKKNLSFFYNKMLQKDSSIITFNYDLILEKYLFSKGIWFPLDGYGFLIESIPKINSEYENLTSHIQILKLHGSLNWKVDPLFHDSIELEWYNDFNENIFPNYLADEKKRNFIYQGGFSTKSWLLPSWIKQFTYPEIIKVWNKASKVLNEADEIVFIGYSLPQADSAAYSLFANANQNYKNITIIDPNAESLLENYSIIFPKERIKTISKSLENYLSN